MGSDPSHEEHDKFEFAAYLLAMITSIDAVLCRYILRFIHRSKDFSRRTDLTMAGLTIFAEIGYIRKVRETS